ncbi:MAG: hypothetical protein HZA22_11290 [Nitrospirae bacterium]|nr:hypothetical protein [Nitrospirota bacterium]
MKDDSYQSIANKPLEWLKLQPHDTFRPQPYEQLAKIFREMGRDSDAKEILIAKQDAQLKYLEKFSASWFWKIFLKYTIGYGYKTYYAIIYLSVMLLLGWALYAWGFASQFIVHTSQHEGCYLCSPFNSFIYSLDVLIPVVDLCQTTHWIPDVGNSNGLLIRVAIWVETVWGWLFSSMAIASLTGLVKKD